MGRKAKGMMKTLLFAVLLLTVCASQAQEVDSLVSGYWSGELTQSEGGFAPTYIFEMYIEVNGETVSGQAIVSTPDSLTATMVFEGKIHRDGYLNLQETHLLEGTTMTAYEWCLKQYSLYLRPKGDEYFLVGYWTGVSKTSVCVPGKIKLRRRRNRV